MKTTVVDEDGPTGQQFNDWFWGLLFGLTAVDVAVVILFTDGWNWAWWTVTIVFLVLSCYVSKWSRYFAWRQWAKRWNKQPGHAQSYVGIMLPLRWWKP